MSKPHAALTAEPPFHDFAVWWKSEPHRLKYAYDDPAYLAAWEAWKAARAVPVAEPVGTWNEAIEACKAAILGGSFLHAESPIAREARLLAKRFDELKRDAHPPVQPTEPVAYAQARDAARWRTIEHAMRHVALQACGPLESAEGFDPRQIESLQRLRAFVDDVARSKRETLLAHPPVQPTEPK